jgi:hypothetical protein
MRPLLTRTLKRLNTLARRIATSRPGPASSEWGEFVAVTRTTPQMMKQVENSMWRSCKSTLIKIASHRSPLGVFNRNQMVMPTTLKILIKTPTGLANPINMYSTVAWKFHSMYLPYRDNEQRLDLLMSALPTLKEEFHQQFKVAAFRLNGGTK